VSAAYCPRCGSARIGSSHFCATCGLDFETISPSGVTAQTRPEGLTPQGGLVTRTATPERPVGPLAWVGAATLGVGVFIGSGFSLGLLLPSLDSSSAGWASIVIGIAAAGLAIGARTVKRWLVTGALTFGLIFLVAALFYVLAGQPE
jgi:hypothetical protein